MSGEWEQGLCSCFNDLTTCIVTWLVPFYTVGKNAEAVGDSCILCGLAFFVPFLNFWSRVHIRGKIREQRGIPGTCVGDCCLIYWCPLCTVCQEAQEIKSIGSQSMARE